MQKLTYFLLIVCLSIAVASCDTKNTQTGRDEALQEGDSVAGGDYEALENKNQQARETEIVAADMKYNPKEIRVKQGQKVRIKFVNNGNKKHNIKFKLPDGEKELKNPIEPGKSATLEFTAPVEAGTYTFYCPVDDHHQKGMEGKLIVE